jgi:hypothetical protein
MGLKLKKAINQIFAWLPPKKISDLFMSHTQLQVCIKLDNSIGEKNQLISKSLPKTIKNNINYIISKEYKFTIHIHIRIKNSI